MVLKIHNEMEVRIMKLLWKINMVVLTIILMFSYVPRVAEASTQKPIKVYMDGKQIKFATAKPYMDKNRVLIPLRTVQENMKAKVTFDNKLKQITSVKSAKNQNTRIKLTINSSYIFYEYSYLGKTEQKVERIDVPARLKGNSTYVPLRAAIESMGYDVSWDSKNYKVSIKTNATIKPKPNKNQYVVYGDSNQIVKMDLDLFYLTNAERISRGIKPLAYDVENSKVARLKSKDMHNKKYFLHTSPTYGTPFEMLDKYKVDYQYAGENLAAGFSTAKEAVNAWMNSAGHKENLLRPEFERVGFGYFKGPDEYKHYYTQIFTTK